MDHSLYKAYLKILQEELVPAMGCTEPIAVAYAGALAARVLGCPPERVEVAASANIIKNVKSVVVPHTGGRRGIAAAAAAGIIAGDPEAELEVLQGIGEAELEALGHFLDTVPVQVERSGKPICLISRCGCLAAGTRPLQRSQAATPTSLPCSGMDRCWWSALMRSSRLHRGQSALC